MDVLGRIRDQMKKAREREELSGKKGEFRCRTFHEREGCNKVMGNWLDYVGG